MIPGFEDFTFELTEEEKEIAGAIADMFNKAVGEKNAVKASEITKLFSGSGIRMGGPRVRKMIQHIRVHDLSPNLIATSKGYYVAENDEEFTLYTEGLRSRIRSQQFTLACIIHHNVKRKADGRV